MLQMYIFCQNNAALKYNFYSLIQQSFVSKNKNWPQRMIQKYFIKYSVKLLNKETEDKSFQVMEGAC